MGKKGIRGLKTKMGRESCISTGGAVGPSSTMEVYKLEETEEGVLVEVGSPEQWHSRKGSSRSESCHEF